MNDSLQGKIEAIRQALGDTADSHLIAEFAPAVERRDGLTGLPEGLAELLAVSNGIRAGVITIFPYEDIPARQFMIEDLPAVPQGGERFLCFAMGADFPLAIERSSGAVWWFPELDAEDYFMTDRFEQLTDDVDHFVDYYVTGEGYRQFSGGSPDSWWDRFLIDHDYVASDGAN